MPVRGPSILLLLSFIGLLLAGCISERPAGTPTPGARNFSSAIAYSEGNPRYAYARSLVPGEIPGFVLESRAKEPMTIWDEPYHFRGFWTPENTSAFNGSVESLSVDVYVYSDRAEALEWFRTFEADSDGPLTLQGINTSYQFRGGVAEIVFLRDDVIISSSAIADMRSSGSGSGEKAAREVAVMGAEMLIRKLQ